MGHNKLLVKTTHVIIFWVEFSLKHETLCTYLALGLISRDISNHSFLSRAATFNICASYGPYTPTDSDPNYTGNLTLMDEATGFMNPSSPWTTVTPCLTSGENKTSVKILALPKCLWVINHQFMNHKCVGASRDDLWQGVLFVGTCERQMCRIGLQPEWCSFFKCGQVDKGNERGVWETLSWPFRHLWRHLTPDTAGRSRAKANRGQNDVRRVCRQSFTNGGRVEEEVKLNTTKELKLWSVWVFKGQFQYWLTLHISDRGFIPSQDTTPFKVQNHSEE